MDLTRLLAAKRIALDTALFIYLIDEHPIFSSAVSPLFAAIASGRVLAVTSALTLLEVMVVPLRNGDALIADRYQRILTDSFGLLLAEIDQPVLLLAAKLRATSRLKTPDAIQLATALGAGCEFFVTNDRDLPDIAGLRIVQLRELI